MNDKYIKKKDKRLSKRNKVFSLGTNTVHTPFSMFTLSQAQDSSPCGLSIPNFPTQAAHSILPGAWEGLGTAAHSADQGWV